jgi:hypothetical protein
LYPLPGNDEVDRTISRAHASYMYRSPCKKDVQPLGGGWRGLGGRGGSSLLPHPRPG